jgi:hypothetical protein
MARRFPKPNDRFRYMLTRAPVWRLLLYYVLVNLVIAALLAALTPVLAMLAADTTGGAVRTGPVGELVVGYLALLVGQDWPASGVTAFSGFAALQAATGIIGIILPAMLLGAVVFRVMTPKSDLVEFEPHLFIEDATPGSATEGLAGLVSTFHIRTPVRCYDLSVTLHLKYFKRNKRGQPNEEERFPWHSVTLGTGLTGGDNLALPYDLIPTRFRTQAQIFRDPDAFRTAVASTGQQNLPLILIEDGRISHVYVDGRNLRRQDADSEDHCDLMVVVHGSLPDAQAELMEVHRYDLFNDFRDTADLSKAFEVEYVRRTDDYYVSKLHDRRRFWLWTLIRRLRGPRHF